MSQEELRRQIDRLEPRVFYSPQLCARYFTYMSRDTGAHFVLFDDGETLRKKQELALSLGIQRFFWVYPEIEDLSNPEFLCPQAEKAPIVCFLRTEACPMRNCLPTWIKWSWEILFSSMCWIEH